MKKIISLILALLVVLTMFVSCEKISETETNFVLIDVKDYGKIVVELYPDVAPITVANFKKLVSEKFYDGLIFHRVIEGFVIQGGAYTDDYQYREAATIKGEFSSK